MTHHATAAFWRLFEQLPEAARVGLRYRALGVDVPDGVLWFWIGSHTDYDKLVTRSPTR